MLKKYKHQQYINDQLFNCLKQKLLSFVKQKVLKLEKKEITNGLQLCKILKIHSGNLFQIHGMTQQITLFQNGTSNSTDNSSNPQLNMKLSSILQNGWKQEDVYQRTSKAVGHISEFIPSFSSAVDPRKPLYGAQQIPGNNPDLRSAQISYEQNQNYGKAEIVKASTAISVANDLIKKLADQFPVPTIRAFQFNEYEIIEKYRSQHQQIVHKAKQLAQKEAILKNQHSFITDFYIYLFLLMQLQLLFYNILFILQFQMINILYNNHIREMSSQPDLDPQYQYIFYSDSQTVKPLQDEESQHQSIQDIQINDSDPDTYDHSTQNVSQQSQQYQHSNLNLQSENESNLMSENFQTQTQ